ncbi:gliding motility-associated C-terminal domain-containing protein, partial [Lutibacter agarilyticus]
ESDSSVAGCGNSMVITRTWTATDACGNETAADQVITIEDMTPPTLSDMPSDISVTCLSEVPGDQGVIATDSCDDSPIVTFTQSESPSCNGQVVNTWTASDACGNTVVYNQTITINDVIAPEFTSDLPNNLTTECNEIPIVGEITASDNCGGDVEVQFEEEIITNEGGCSQSYIIKRVWVAVDCAGNSVSHTQEITVIDTTPPTIIDAPEIEITVVCSEIPDPAEIVGVDNCSSDISVMFEEQSTEADAEGNYQIIRVWVLLDECENETAFVQTLNVIPIVYDEVETFDLCITETPLDLLVFLSGVSDTTGVWSDDDNSNAMSSDMLLDPSMLVEGDTYTFTYTAGTDCVSKRSIAIRATNDCVVLACESPETIEISKVVTANNDGINDTFTVSDVSSCGFTAAVKIFNRWGKQVYESDNYRNNWGGYHDNSGPTLGSGNKLPTGTYYYIVNIIGSGFQPRTGYIYLGTN